MSGNTLSFTLFITSNAEGPWAEWFHSQWLLVHLHLRIAWQLTWPRLASCCLCFLWVVYAPLGPLAWWDLMLGPQLASHLVQKGLSYNLDLAQSSSQPGLSSDQWLGSETCAQALSEASAFFTYLQVTWPSPESCERHIKVMDTKRWEGLGLFMPSSCQLLHNCIGVGRLGMMSVTSKALNLALLSRIG